MECIDLRCFIMAMLPGQHEKMSMRRKIILALVIILAALAATLAYVLLRGQPRPAPISIDAANENAIEPLHQEMDCVDQLLENRNNLNANEVQPALARCRAGASGNQSLER
jgi:hypothetical protein